MNSKNNKSPYDLANITKKVFFLFGLLFAQISNFVFWLEEAIPIEEFFIFDMFLIFSLFIIMFKEYKGIKRFPKFTDYTCLLGALNNFIITFFFLSWGILFPEKDMAFVHKLGLDGNFQIVFDLISLISLSSIYKKYKQKIGGLNREKIFLYEVYLIIGLASSLLLL